MGALSNIASSIACILAASTLEQVQCPSSLETIGEMVMSPMCLQLFILGLLPDFFPWQQAVTEQETLMYFFFKQLQKDQNGNGSFGCQDRPVLRSSANPSQYVGTVKDCKVPKQKTVVLYHNHWPKKNSADVMKDRQSINLICAPCWIAVSSF